MRKEIRKLTEDYIQRFEEEFSKSDNQKDQNIRNILSILESNIEIFQTLIKLIETFATKSIRLERGLELVGIREAWLQLREIAERVKKRVLLLESLSRKKVHSENDFYAAIAWMIARGDEADLPLLWKIKCDLLFIDYFSEDYQKLVKKAISKIETRIKQQGIELGIYRISCSETEAKHFSNVKIIENYQTFTIIICNDKKVIADIKRKYSLERLSILHGLEISELRDLVTSEPESLQLGIDDEDVFELDAELYAIAQIKDYQANKPFYLGQIYHLEAGIQNGISVSFYSEQISHSFPHETTQYEISVWAEDMEIIPNWIQPYLLDKSNEISLTQFQLKPTRLGHKLVRVEFFYQKHWLAKIEFEVKVVES